MPATRADLMDYLDELGIKTETHDHEAVFTVEESSKIKQDIPGGHTKNLFLKDKKGNFFLLVAEGSARIELNKVHGLIGASGRVSFGKPDMLMALLGITPGSVTAFCAMNDTENVVQVVIDEPLLKHDLINCHPLTNEATTTISREDLLAFLKAVGHPPLVVKVSQDGDDNEQ
ncbi:MAG: YbaK/EbsC family protein [Pseudomonadota bacterium]